MKYSYYILLILFVSIGLYLYTRIKTKKKDERKSVAYQRSIACDEQESYDMMLDNALDNTTLTFSSAEVDTTQKNNCSKYDNSVLYGAALLEQDGFRFPDMGGV